MRSGAPTPAGIGAFLIGMLAFLIYVIICILFAGCADTAWKAGVYSEPDFTTPNPLIPRAEVSLGGKF